MMSLYEQINAAFQFSLRPNLEESYGFILKNLRYALFPWQKNALENFVFWENSRLTKLKEIPESLLKPTHLMFNMATGSGKTMVMAALILYYYKQGYRNFIFFVNQKNIVSKTQENFVNKNHGKYLFAPQINIDGKNVNIREVNVFSNSSDDIQIKFTTIHALHGAVYRDCEKNLLLNDLHKRDLVLIADESHHLNASSKQQTPNFIDDAEMELSEKSSDDEIARAWETTVQNIILEKRNRDGSKANFGVNKNVLLEFTATIPEQIRDKYEDKIIAKFDLRDFVIGGYTKDINLITSSFTNEERILLALAFNWLRCEIAIKNKIQNFKPVILFRSKTIEDSRKDYDSFLVLVRNLTPRKFRFLKKENDEAKLNEAEKSYHQSASRILYLKEYIAEEFNQKISDLITFIQSNFDDRTCVITNSKDNKTKSECTSTDVDTLLNSLEEPKNFIRAIFTVNRLTEGWDVQNLYDIVRLYSGRDRNAKNKKSGKSTVSEVQLIGRGVRYYPFIFNGEVSRKRRFDGDLKNEMRLLEEFYFHSDEDEKYISELIQELKNQKLIEDSRVKKIFKLKNEFSMVANNLYLYCNEKIVNKNRKQKKATQGIV